MNSRKFASRILHSLGPMAYAPLWTGVERVSLITPVWSGHTSVATLARKGRGLAS